MRALLLRHGESTWNAVRRWQGQADPPLSDRGEAQAAEACRAAAELGGFDLVVTSGLRRARRTGEILAAGLGVDLAEAVGDLNERSAGEWEGLTRVEINERYPGYLDDGRRPTGYEPDPDVVTRATNVLLTLSEPPPRTPLAQTPQARLGTQTPQARLGGVLVVTHGGVINALERHAEEEWRRLDNLEGRWFDIDVAGRSIQPVGGRVQLLAPTDDHEDGIYA